MKISFHGAARNVTGSKHLIVAYSKGWDRKQMN
jgi:hypothetical protein